MEEQSKIKSFIDLNAWKKGHELVIEIYLVTKEFPDDEKFGLTNQIRRCAISITSNIAEGFSRRTSKDKMQFYFIALGSTTELQNQLLIAKDVGYLEKCEFERLAEEVITIHKIINGLIKSIRVKHLA